MAHSYLSLIMGAPPVTLFNKPDPKVLAKQEFRNQKTDPNIHRLPTGHRWIYDKILGEGGQGVAHLWNQIDQDNAIVDRVVIKNFQLRPWSDVIFSGPGKGHIREVYVQQKLADGDTLPEDQFTVATLAVQPVRGTKLKAMWRTYAPFYSMGSLSDLIRPVGEKKPHPEAFIWYTFWRLAKGVVAMDEKFRNQDKMDPVVVHNDLKPDNVFVNHPGSLGKDADYIMFPAAYIGDFGLAFLTSERRPKNGKYGGTPDFVVPENEFDEEGDKVFEDTDCHSKSNVWAIAYIILLLMERTTDRLRPPATDYVEYNMECWEMLAVEFPGYRKELIRTVESCLAPTMEERPSPQELLETVEGYLEKYSDGMKRWGTLSWATDLHNKLQAEAHPSSTTSFSDDDEGGTPIPGPSKGLKGLKTSKSSPPSKFSKPPKSTIPSKRKSDAPLPPSKRPKDQDSRLDRRLTNLAYQILYGAQVKTPAEPFISHPSFILKPRTRRVKYSTKHFPPIMRPELFFYTPEPEKKEHRIEPRVFVDWLHGMGREERELVIEEKWWKKLFEEGEVIEGEPRRKSKKGTGVLPFRVAKDNAGDDKEGGGVMI
ncbi:hypothetical protein VTO58DRAFT_109262 [Aureobasidium pullulans]